MGAIPLYHEEIEYPTSDGEPIAETGIHVDVIFELVDALERRYRHVPDVWMQANFFLCYEEGNPRAFVCPDVALTRGIPKGPRDNYLLWQERAPSLILEATSPTTAREDLGKKKGIYERIGAEEYLLFDPRDEYLKPRLQGYRLEGSRYVPILPEPDGSLLSRTTGLLFRPEGSRLRLTDAATGEPIPWREEVHRMWEEADRMREEAEERARRLEEELARLRAQ